MVAKQESNAASKARISLSGLKAFERDFTMFLLLGCEYRTKYEYDPFGNTTYQSGTFADANPFRFSAKYWDADSKLYYYGYRWYGPGMGRWTSRDPIEDIAFRRQFYRHEYRGNPLLDVLRSYRSNPGRDLRFIDNDPINYFDRIGLAKASPKEGEPCKPCGMCNKCSFSFRLEDNGSGDHIKTRIGLKYKEKYGHLCCHVLGYKWWTCSWFFQDSRKTPPEGGYSQGYRSGNDILDMEFAGDPNVWIRVVIEHLSCENVSGAWQWVKKTGEKSYGGTMTPAGTRYWRAKDKNGAHTGHWGETTEAIEKEIGSTE